MPATPAATVRTTDADVTGRTTRLRRCVCERGHAGESTGLLYCAAACRPPVSRCVPSARRFLPWIRSRVRAVQCSEWYERPPSAVVVVRRAAVPVLPRPREGRKPEGRRLVMVRRPGRAVPGWLLPAEYDLYVTYVPGPMGGSGTGTSNPTLVRCLCVHVPVLVVWLA